MSTEPKLGFVTTRAVVLALFLGFVISPVFGLPDWIWIDSPATAEGVVFYHDFDADPARLQSAHLRLVTDFTNVKITINGQQAGIAEAFEPVLRLDALPLLLSGVNEIRLMGKTTGDAPAVALQLDLIDRHGGREPSPLHPNGRRQHLKPGS